MNHFKQIFWTRIVPGLAAQYFVGVVLMSLSYDLVGDIKRQSTMGLGMIVVLFAIYRTYISIRALALISNGFFRDELDEDK